MALILTLIIYNILFPFVLVFYLPKHIYKLFRRGGDFGVIFQRFGFVSLNLQDDFKKETIWIHAVSVGEVQIAVKFLKEFYKKDKSINFILSITTPTGMRVAKNSGIKNAYLMYNTLDFLPFVYFSFVRLKPKALILVEAELWPNLISIASYKKIPVVLLNARLSDRSERRYLKFNFFVRPIFRIIDLACTADITDSDRYLRLGVRRSKLSPVGNLKFDVSTINNNNNKVEELRNLLNYILKIQGNEKKDFPTIITFGSSHAGEEELLIKSFKKLSVDFSNLFIIIAPRHFERCDRLFKELKSYDDKVVLRTSFIKKEDGGFEYRNIDSKIDGGNKQHGNYDFKKVGSGAPNVLILNNTGELSHWYYLSDIILIGKSFIGKGGQNPFEAVLANKAIIMGPNMDNFKKITKVLIERKGAIQLKNKNNSEKITPTQLTEVISELLSNPFMLKTLAHNSQSIISTHNLSTKRAVDLIYDKIFIKNR